MTITTMKVKYVVTVANHVMLGSSRRPGKLYKQVCFRVAEPERKEPRQAAAIARSNKVARVRGEKRDEEIRDAQRETKSCEWGSELPPKRSANIPLPISR